MFYIALIYGLIVYPTYDLDQVGIAESDSVKISFLNFTFQLEKAQSSLVVSFDGNEIIEDSNDDCYYTSESVASFHLCNGVYGTFISDNGTFYKIEPIENEVGVSDSDSSHLLIQQDPFDSSFCGYDELDMPKMKIKRVESADVSTASRVVDTIVYLDDTFTTDRGVNAIKDAQTYLNAAAAMYAKNTFAQSLTLNTTAIIVLRKGLLTLPSSQLITDLLPLFYSFVTNLKTNFTSISYLQQPDISFLLSHKATLPSSTVGLAYVGGACKLYGNHNTGVATRLNNRQDSWISLIIAHEIGHLLGASHDGTGNTCASSGSVMGPYISDPNPQITKFSSCSINYINNFMAIKGTECLVTQSNSTSPICGNGFLDSGEECDPGQNESNCCTSDCKLKADAQCDDKNGPCCSGCKLKSTTSICRPIDVTLGCDENEFCNGFSPLCPADSAAYADGPCEINDNKGVCYEGGFCMSRQRACESLRGVLKMPLYFDSRCDTKNTCSIICSDGLKCYDFTGANYLGYYKQGQVCGSKLTQFCNSNGICGDGKDPIETDNLPQNSTANRPSWF